MARIEDYDAKDFFEVHDGIIHWLGYFYNEGGWYMLQYGDFTTPVADFANKYDHSAEATYEAEGIECDQWLACETDNRWNEVLMRQEFDAWMKDATPIRPIDINENIPDGRYVMTEVA